ncbi:Uncharacterised protein [uncultured archaeon]|nr:Uncharacterised protein [uncultured archaeon]
MKLKFKIIGILHLFSETGTEGGWWAIQDISHIHQDSSIPGGFRWDYEGLHIIKSGDFLKIFNPDGTIYWKGTIELQPYDEFTHDANGLWIHCDPKNVDKNFWYKAFFDQYNGELIRYEK